MLGSLASQTFFVGGARGKGKGMSGSSCQHSATTLPRFWQNHIRIVMWCAVSYRPLIMIWRAVHVRRMEEDMRWGRLPSIWGIRAYGKNKFSSERNLKWQRYLCYRLSMRARRIRRACACWARDKVCDFLDYFKFQENSEIDMSYQTFFFPSRKLRP